MFELVHGYVVSYTDDIQECLSKLVFFFGGGGVFVCFVTSTPLYYL